MTESTARPIPATSDEDAAVVAVRTAVLDDATFVRAVVSGRRRNEQVPYRRIELRYVDLAAGRRLQVTSYDERQAHVRNVELSRVPTELEALIATPYNAWHVETASETVQLRVTKKGRWLLQRSRRAVPVSPDRGHDREKRRWLDEDDPLFVALGMTSSEGVILPSRRAKFRQVQDLLAVLDPVIPTPAGDSDRLEVVDLGCGNAYLTFAAVRYLTGPRSMAVRATGVDTLAQARAHGEDVAATLGLSGVVTFVEGTIVDAEVAARPDLVLALHACDTATDDALARAVRWQTPVIIAAPCCHHDLQRQLAGSSDATPSPYRLVTRHGILSERFADVLTDALRAAILRLLGYRVDVMEFVDSVHTPRNAVIRAVYTGAEPEPATVEAYEQLTREWSVVPALARRLDDLHPALRPASTPS